MSYLDFPPPVLLRQLLHRPVDDQQRMGNFDPNVVLQDSDPKAPGYESWYPDGSAFFQFLNCQITGAVGSDGTGLAAGTTNPILCATVATPQTPPTQVAKIVDLDPDQ